MFLSQLPYVPLGNLRGVVCYQNEPGDVSDDTLREALTKVALAPLSDRLDDEEDWAKVLSPGERQRIAFARILLTRPASGFPRRSHLGTDLPAGLRFCQEDWCAPNCPTASWSASATGRPSNSTTTTCWNCLAKANGSWGGWKRGSRRPASVRMVRSDYRAVPGNAPLWS